MKQRIFSLALAVALAASAAPCLANAPDAAPSAKTRYSVDTRISDLLANPQAAEVLRAFVQEQRVASGKPELTTEQQAHMIQMVMNMTPREVAKFPQAHMDDTGLSKLNAQLAQVSAPAKG